MTTFLEHVSYVILNVHEIDFKMRVTCLYLEKKYFCFTGGWADVRTGQKLGGRYPLK